MTYDNITLYYDACIRDGEADFADRKRHSYVEYDSRTYYYDLAYSDVSLAHWAAFIEDNFDSNMSYGITEHGEFWARVVSW